MTDAAPQRRGRGATFAGFTEKIREKISAAPPAPLNLGDPNVRSELAKEYQPSTVELEKGEWFDEVKHDGKAVQLKMTKAGIAIVDPLTKAAGDVFEWQYIADFRVGKNKKTFAIMHDGNKDGTKLTRVEFKSKETMRMLGTATKFVDVLAAEMREKAAKDAEAAAKLAEEPAHKKKDKKKAAKKSGLGQHSHSPRGEGDDDADADAKKKDDASGDDKNEDNSDGAAAEKKPRRQRRGTRRKDDEDAPAAKEQSEEVNDDANDAAPAADGDGAAKPRRARRGTKSKVTDGGEAADPLIEKKKKARSRAQTTM